MSTIELPELQIIAPSHDPAELYEKMRHSIVLYRLGKIDCGNPILQEYRKKIHIQTQPMHDSEVIIWGAWLDEKYPAHAFGRLYKKYENIPLRILERYEEARNSIAFDKIEIWQFSNVETMLVGERREKHYMLARWSRNQKKSLTPFKEVKRAIRSRLRSSESRSEYCVIIDACSDHDRLFSNMKEE